MECCDWPVAFSLSVGSPALIHHHHPHIKKLRTVQTSPHSLFNQSLCFELTLLGCNCILPTDGPYLPSSVFALSVTNEWGQRSQEQLAKQICSLANKRSLRSAATSIRAAQTHTPTHTYLHMHPCTHLLYTHTPPHTPIHTPTHTFTHTYTHTALRMVSFILK